MGTMFYYQPTPGGSRIRLSHGSSGQVVYTRLLAKVYRFTDCDDSQPDAWRDLVEVQDPGKPAAVTGHR